MGQCAFAGHFATCAFRNIKGGSPGCVISSKVRPRQNKEHVVFHSVHA